MFPHSAVFRIRNTQCVLLMLIINRKPRGNAQNQSTGEVIVKVAILLSCPLTATPSLWVERGRQTWYNIFYFLILFCEFYRITYRLIIMHKTLAFSCN